MIAAQENEGTVQGKRMFESTGLLLDSENEVPSGLYPLFSVDTVMNSVNIT